MDKATRHSLSIPASWIVGVLCAACISSGGRADLSLEFLADLNIATGVMFEDLSNIAAPVETAGEQTPREVILRRKASGGFGGISALSYDAEAKSLYALSDSSNTTLFVLSLSLAEGAIEIAPQRFIRLADEAGVPLPLWTLDPEGLAVTRDGEFLVASEGYVRRDPSVDPGVFRFDLEGRLLGDLPLPSRYLPRRNGSAQEGITHNQGFESLSLSPSGRLLYVATEGSLSQDSAECTASDGCLVRVLQYQMDGGAGEPAAEYLYRTDPSIVDSLKLAEILLLDDYTMLALERGFERLDDGTPLQTIRIYQAELPLEPTGEPVEKRLVLDLDAVRTQFSQGYQMLDNYEGMCLGPRLPSGDRTLLLISDNNYNDSQRTSLLAFRMIEN